MDDLKKYFAIPMATYFARGGKVGKTPLGVASEQTTAFRLGLQFRLPRTPRVTTGAHWRKGEMPFRRPARMVCAIAPGLSPWWYQTLTVCAVP